MLYKTVTTYNKKRDWHTVRLYEYTTSDAFEETIESLMADGLYKEARWYHANQRDPWLLVSSAGGCGNLLPRPDHANVTRYVTRANECYYYHA